MPCYEQGIDKEGVPEGVLDTYVAEPQSRGGGFYQGIVRARETYPFGTAVGVKDPAQIFTVKFTVTPRDSGPHEGTRMYN